LKLTNLGENLICICLFFYISCENNIIKIYVFGCLTLTVKYWTLINVFIKIKHSNYQEKIKRSVVSLLKSQKCRCIFKSYAKLQVNFRTKSNYLSQFSLCAKSINIVGLIIVLWEYTKLQCIKVNRKGSKTPTWRSPCDKVLKARRLTNEYTFRGIAYNVPSLSTIKRLLLLQILYRIIHVYGRFFLCVNISKSVLSVDFFSLHKGVLF